MEITKRLALALLIGAAGCSSNNDIKTSEIADTSAALSGALVREIGASVGFLPNLTALNSTIDQAQATVPGVGGTPGTPVAPPPAGLSAAAAPLLMALQPAPTTQNPLLSAGRWLATAVVDPGTQTAEDQAAAELENFLKTRVFNESNRESGNSGSATFLLHGSTFCTDGTYPADPGCVQGVDDLQLRIKATKAGGGFDFVFQVGPTKANPVSLGLRSGSLSVTFDLSGIKDAVAHLETVTGTTIPMPAIMAGQFRLAVNKLAESHVSFVASVPAAIHVQVTDAGETFDFTTGATPVLLKVEADASVALEGVLTFQLGLGRTTFSLPYVPYFAAASPVNAFDTFGIDLGGFSVTLVAHEATPDVVEINGVGLGATQTRAWARSGTNAVVDAITVDLQDGAGAPTNVDLLVESDPVTGDGTLTATPFELSVYLGLSLLDLDVPATTGSGNYNDTYTIALSAGTAGDPQLFLPAACDAVADPACVSPPPRLDSGTLAVTAAGDAGSVNFTAAEGQCLFGDGVDPHPVFGTLRADVCPP